MQASIARFCGSVSVVITWAQSFGTRQARRSQIVAKADGDARASFGQIGRCLIIARKRPFRCLIVDDQLERLVGHPPAAAIACADGTASAVAPISAQLLR